MQRILHIVGKMDRAGAETMIMNLYREIDRAHFQFDFITFTASKGDYDDEIIALGGKIIPIVASNNILRTIKLKRFLTENKQYTIVHSHMLLNAGFHVIAAKLAGVKHRIVHAHNTHNRKTNYWGKLYENISKKIIKNFTTYRIACGVKASEFLFDKLPSKILYNAIDVDQYINISRENSKYIQKQYKISARTKIYIQVGRLENVKNHFFSLQLMKELKVLNEDFIFFIIGQGSLDQELRNQVKALDLQENIIFTGVRSDIPYLMAGADLMIMPSFHEGFPVVLVESQAIGLPTLVSINVSNEVDLGLNLIKFLPLDEVQNWVKELTKHKQLITIQDRKNILTNKGFDVKSNVKDLQKIYNSMK